MNPGDDPEYRAQQAEAAAEQLEREARALRLTTAAPEAEDLEKRARSFRHDAVAIRAREKEEWEEALGTLRQAQPQTKSAAPSRSRRRNLKRA